MTVTIKKSTIILHELTLLNFEMKLGQKLPDDYRNFLLEYNGGDPEPNMVGIPETRKQCSVACIFGLYNFKKDHDLAAKRKRLANRLPEKVIPIAEADGDNFICLSLDSPDFGAVYLWDHELATDPPSRENLFELAPAFTDFLAVLQVFDPAAMKKGGFIDRIFGSLKKLFRLTST